MGHRVPIFQGQLQTSHIFREYWKDIDRWRIRSVEHGVDKVTVVRPLFSRSTSSILQVGHNSVSRRLLVISRCYGNKMKLRSLDKGKRSFVSLLSAVQDKVKSIFFYYYDMKNYSINMANCKLTIRRSNLYTIYSETCDVLNRCTYFFECLSHAKIKGALLIHQLIVS